MAPANLHGITRAIPIKPESGVLVWQNCVSWRLEFQTETLSVRSPEFIAGRARLPSRRIEPLNAISELAATLRLAAAIAFCVLAVAGCTWRLPHGVAEQYIADLQAFN